MMKDVTIGIDIGGTHFRIGTVAVDGSLSGFEKISSGKFGGGDGVSVLVDEVRGYMERWKPDGNVKAVTIGIDVYKRQPLSFPLKMCRSIETKFAIGKRALQSVNLHFASALSKKEDSYGDFSGNEGNHKNIPRSLCVK